MVGMLGLAAHRTFLRLVSAFRHIRRRWEAMVRRATRPPHRSASTARRSTWVAPAIARRSRDGRRAASLPAPSNAARRSSARASKARSVLRKLDQRGAAARAHDLDEAEAVDRGALERLRKMASIASPAFCRAALLPLVGRSIPIDPPMSSRRIALAASAAPATASSSGGRVPSTSIRVIAGVGDMRSSPPAKANDAGAGLLDQVVPPRRAELVASGRERGGFGLRAEELRADSLGNFRQWPFPRLGFRGLPRESLRWSAAAPSVTAPARRSAEDIRRRSHRLRRRCGRWRQCSSAAPGAGFRRASRRRGECGLQRSCRHRPAPRGFRRCRARPATQAMSYTRRDFRSTRVSASGSPTTLE